MQFASKEDIEAPIGDVFTMLSEFESFERSAIRRGIEVQRQDPDKAPGVGMRWHARFVLRGKPRELDLELVQYDRPNTMRFEAASPGIDGQMTLDLVPLSQRRTRMAVVLEIKPKTLSARLLVQSLKLARNNLNKRFKLRVASYAKDLEDRQQGTA